MTRRDAIRTGAVAGASAAALGLASTALADEAAAQDAAAPGFRSSEGLEGVRPPIDGEVAFVAEPIDKSLIAEVVDAEVVVVGAGWAGCCAAAAAADCGASVVLLQKGDSVRCNGAQCAAIGDKVHAHYGEEIDAKAYIADIMYTANYRADEGVVRRCVYKSGEAMDWLMGIVEGKVEYPGLMLEKHEVRRGINWYASAVDFGANPGMIGDVANALLDYAVSLGNVDVRFDTPGCQLVQDADGRVVGVIGKAADGSYVKFNAAKGVVLATGGYEFNWERLKRCLRPRDLQVHSYMNLCSGNTGDGHEMGLAVGAYEDEYPHCICSDPSGTRSGAAFGAALHAFLRVNDCGQRFVNEGIPVNFLANAVSNQVGAHDWVITDSKMAEDMQKIRDQAVPGMTSEAEAEMFIADSEVGETLEELAGKMGVDPEVFVATVTRYNEMVAQGEDVDFHKPVEKLTDVTVPPFYACDEGTVLLSTENGLVVNSDAAVLNRETKAPIPGLYAVGTCAGSMFHDTYPHHCSGISLSRGLTYGWIVGRILSGVDEPVNK